MTEACVFIGPTLSAGDVAAHLDARCLPPAAQGDIVEAVRAFRPRAIGIVDGFFAGAPAVWHKEILWAMAEGVAVFGAASMGALRAAELHAFGMRGVGHIFADYRDGRLADDDEVAVVHAPAEMGYAALSEPMVNIRATLAVARAEGILSAASGAALVEAGKSLHFPDRGWPRILGGAAARSLPVEEIARFAAWLKTGRVDLKRADALAMLAAMRPAASTAPDAPRFRLATTHLLAALLDRPAPPAAAWAEDALQALVLDELRLGSRALFAATTASALLRVAAERGADGGGRRNHEVAADEVARKRDEIRAALGLFGRSSLDGWLARNDLDADALAALAIAAVRIDRLAEQAGPSLEPYLLDALRLGGDYERLAARARRKRAALAACGADAAGPRSGHERLAARLWFCESRLGLSEDPGTQAILARTGFADASSLDRALHHEGLYRTLAGPDRED